MILRHQSGCRFCRFRYRLNDAHSRPLKKRAVQRPPFLFLEEDSGSPFLRFQPVGNTVQMVDDDLEIEALIVPNVDAERGSGEKTCCRRMRFPRFPGFLWPIQSDLLWYEIPCFAPTEPRLLHKVSNTVRLKGNRNHVLLIYTNAQFLLRSGKRIHTIPQRRLLFPHSGFLMMSGCAMSTFPGVVLSTACSRAVTALIFSAVIVIGFPSDWFQPDCRQGRDRGPARSGSQNGASS